MDEVDDSDDGWPFISRKSLQCQDSLVRGRRQVVVVPFQNTVKFRKALWVPELPGRTQTSGTKGLLVLGNCLVVAYHHMWGSVHAPSPVTGSQKAG